MRAIRSVLVAAALVAAPGNGPAAAQSVLVGGGAAVPLGLLNTATNTGAHGLAAISIAPAILPVSIRIDGMYGRFGLSHNDIDGHFSVLHSTANAVYQFPGHETTTIRPYLIGGLGVYSYKFITDLPVGRQDEAHTDIGINGGAGVDIVAGALGVFAETRYHSVMIRGENPEYLPVTVGIRHGRR